MGRAVGYCIGTSDTGEFCRRWKGEFVPFLREGGGEEEGLFGGGGSGVIIVMMMMVLMRKKEKKKRKRRKKKCWKSSGLRRKKDVMEMWLVYGTSFPRIYISISCPSIRDEDGEFS